MNPLVEHHQQSIRFQYSCFDRMLLNAVVQPMQQLARIVGFLDKCRQVPSITKVYFSSVSEGYHRFVARLAATHRVQIVQPPKGVRREEWVDAFYQPLRREPDLALAQAEAKAYARATQRALEAVRRLRGRLLLTFRPGS